MNECICKRDPRGSGFKGLDLECPEHGVDRPGQGLCVTLPSVRMPTEAPPTDSGFPDWESLPEIPPSAPARADFPASASASAIWSRLIDSWRTYGRTLPVDSAFRKEFPIDRGVYQYFPAAIVCCAAWSKFNNDKHNPGEQLHHSRGKSSDHEECIARHGFDLTEAQRRGDDVSELEEAVAVFWRAGVRVQLLAERLGAPLAPGARLPEGGSK